jgi:hypothetical protein
MTPALVITLMILGWGAAAVAMLWGILRTARYHHRHASGRHAPAPRDTSGDHCADSAKEMQLPEYSA